MLQELEATVDSGRLRKCIEEFAHLSRGDVTVEQFFRRFMPGLVQAIRGRGTSIWFPQGQEFTCAGSTGMEETDYAADPRQRAAINSAVRQAAEHRQPVIVPPGDAEGGRGHPANYKPFPFFMSR